MKWKYTKYCKRLDVFGTDSDKDMKGVKKLIADKKIPPEIDSIVYRKARNSTVAMIIRGRYLDRLLRIEEGPVVPLPPRQRLKDILAQINETNTRQATYSGILLYCTQTKHFLLFETRNRGKRVQLLGDNPIGPETPAETVYRVCKEDGDFEIPPTSLVPLSLFEVDGTTYYSHLCFTNHEFKPNLSDRLITSMWVDYTKLDELPLHPIVAALFEKDKILQRLTKPADVLEGLDFDQLITDILHST